MFCLCFFENKRTFKLGGKMNGFFLYLYTPSMSVCTVLMYEMHSFYLSFMC